VVKYKKAKYTNQIPRVPITPPITWNRPANQPSSFSILRNIANNKIIFTVIGNAIIGIVTFI
jgi:hypothetical protein